MLHDTRTFLFNFASSMIAQLTLIDVIGVLRFNMRKAVALLLRCYQGIVGSKKWNKSK